MNTTIKQTRRKRRDDLVLRALPPISAPLVPDCFDLLAEKFNLCAQICDFTGLESDLAAKEIKASTLKELDALFQQKGATTQWPPDVFRAFQQMLTVNVFRDIPPTDPALLCGIEEPILTDVAWPHLSLVYAILLKYQQANLVNNPLGHEFFIKLLGNLAAPDRNERELVLTYIERHVQANRRDQDFTATKFSNVLKAYRFGCIEPYPVTPILKFFANHWRDHGLASAAQRERLLDDLFDLFASRHVKTLLGPISQLLDVAIESDRKLGGRLFQKCLKMWPKAYPSKQLVYFDLVLFLVERLPHNRLEQMVPSIFGLLAKCALSLHRNLVQRSLKVWNDSRFVATILDLTPRVFPLVFDAIMTVAREHWNPDVRRDAGNTLAAMRKLDQFSFDAQDHKFRKAIRAPEEPVVAAAERKKLERHRSWMTIVRYAGKNHHGMNVPRIMAIIQRGLNEQ